MKKATIYAVDYYLPSKTLTNNELALVFPEFTADKIFAKTGIKQRHISAAEEHSSDMAVKAAIKLFDSGVIARENIDFVIFCTQTPDYLLPTTACLIQDRLGLRKNIGALDINLGCSGYIYGLSLAKALIESSQAKNVLLLTADTYTKLLDPDDRSVRTIFGDGAAATIIIGIEEQAKEFISRTVYGTDGSGAENLCVLGRSMRNYLNVDTDPYLRMQGPEIFEFTLQVVPKVINDLLAQENVSLNDIDLFIFHQANQYMLEHLRKKLAIPQDKFFVAMDFCGNTVSSTIPIALKEAEKQGRLVAAKKVMLVGFGVGYSWGSAIIDSEYMSLSNGIN